MDYNKDLDFKICNGTDRGLCACSVGRQNMQQNTYDWLADVPGNKMTTDLVEVQFKNTRKGYYHNVNNLDLNKGDIVAVEANPGHDIGVVTLTGRLVLLQVKKANLKSADDIRRVYLKAKEVDMTKYKEAKAREHETMIRSRKIAADLGLKMKIGDVEYQGDGNKAIFYYIADERVDFRQLIKVLAENFHVRIEMKQIGARQEAGRIGGTGPCGRELCCATWMKNFSSVSTGAARYQDISLNPQKLAGMCAKLKCCLNYEVDDYMEAGKKLPSKDMILETQDGEYHLFKTDILAGLCTYSTDKNIAANLETITAERAIEVYEMNKKGEKPATLSTGEGATMQNKPIDLLADADLNRFDKENRKKKGGKGKQNKQGGKKQDGKSARGGNKPKQQKEKTSNAARQDKPSNANKPEKSKKPQQNGNKEQHPNNGNHRKERQPKGNRPPRQNNGDKPTQQQHNNENKQ
jgi:cell fate regulator YaaT (PSP1 superfamily)